MYVYIEYGHMFDWIKNIFHFLMLFYVVLDCIKGMLRKYYTMIAYRFFILCIYKYFYI